METGKTLKFIRKNKKITQQEVSDGIIDRTAYSRIEGNDRPLRMSDLRKILDRLSVNVHEFFSFARFDNDQQHFRELMYQCSIQPDNKNRKKEMLQYLKKLDDKEKKDLRELSNYWSIKNYFCRIWDEVPQVTRKEAETAYRMLYTKSYFFQYDYVILTNLIPYFTKKQADFIINKVIPIQDEEKRDSLSRNLAYSTLLNLINIRIYDSDLKTAKKYLKLAKKQAGLFRDYSHRLDLDYLESLSDFLEVGDPTAYEKVLNHVSLIERIGDVKKAEMMRVEIGMLTKNRFKTESLEDKTGLPICLIKVG